MHGTCRFAKFFAPHRRQRYRAVNRRGLRIPIFLEPEDGIRGAGRRL
jgi:hypothetical protein